MNPESTPSSGPEPGPPEPRTQFVEHISLGRRVPVGYWVALAIGVLGFFVEFSSIETRLDDSGYSCTYTNYAGFLVAIVLIVLAIDGWVRWTKRVPIEKLPIPLMAVFTVVILALAVVHVLRGTGSIMSGCEPPPA